MSKVVFLVVLIAAIAQAQPIGDDIASAAARGDWDAVHKLINSRFGEKDIWMPVSSGSVKSLQPVKGGHVYGEAEYTFHASSDVNGRKMESSGGHRVVNNDGKVQEYDFKPKISNQ